MSNSMSNVSLSHVKPWVGWSLTELAFVWLVPSDFADEHGAIFARFLSKVFLEIWFTSARKYLWSASMFSTIPSSLQNSMDEGTTPIPWIHSLPNNKLKLAFDGTTMNKVGLTTVRTVKASFRWTPLIEIRKLFDSYKVKGQTNVDHIKRVCWNY